MGKVLSHVKNPLRNFNVENRAHRVISKDKPIPAPKYKRDKQDIEQLLKDYPKEYEESLKKNEMLDKNLKEIFVQSHDANKEDIENREPNRPLPLSRHIVEDYEFGYKEPDAVPLGKVTLKGALQFITNHQANPKVYNSTKIAEEYFLPEETVKKVLQYYKVYEMYIPEQRDAKAKFAGPAVKRRKIYVEKLKQLTDKSNKDGT